MISKITTITVLVHDQDKALDYYAETLGFELVKDVASGDFRWVSVRPRGQKELELVLIKADTDERAKMVGRQAGDEVLFVAETDDLQKEYDALQSRGVKFTGPPKGGQAIFHDLYGNGWDLIEAKR